MKGHEEGIIEIKKKIAIYRFYIEKIGKDNQFFSWMKAISSLEASLACETILKMSPIVFAEH